MTSAPGLQVSDLRVRRGRAEVIRGITLPQLTVGSVVGLIGRNGVGKSSLLQAVAGLIPFEGTVRLDGSKLDRVSWARRVVYMPDVPLAPVDLTVVEAVRAGIARSERSGASMPAIAAILDMFEIQHLGLVPLATLSAGQRQLVSLAQVSARQATVALLDEPTSCLDLRSQLVALERIRQDTQSRRGVTLMAMHDIGLAAGSARSEDVMSMIRVERRQAGGHRRRLPAIDVRMIATVLHGSAGERGKSRSLLMVRRSGHNLDVQVRACGSTRGRRSPPQLPDALACVSAERRRSRA